MIELELQNVSQALDVPDAASFERWAEAALQRETAELVIRVVDEDESAELNGQYRHKTGPTNVLSFPFESPPGVDTAILGDLVICAPVVAREAREQGKAPVAHWAHMVVHGVLHLQGYDHIDDAEAMTMEAEEVAIMRRLGFANPYEDET
ncbi:rRNA maturation RNase YbeY [Methyloterricola oryzae]|uniref:rRNA maturation RNase YbeY n=1 Tax=Methyloterricola oryzae TaxID=1495050 RepID=UPI0005EBB074|nr:rRNA maturation RNase YbeY [Methyloterricola oryzae]